MFHKNRPLAKITIILRLLEKEPDLASFSECLTPIGTRNGLRLVQVIYGGFQEGQLLAIIGQAIGGSFSGENQAFS